MQTENSVVQTYVTYNWFYFTLSVLFVFVQSLPVRAQDESDMKNSDEKLWVLIEEGQIEKTIGDVDTRVTSSSYSVIEAERFRHSFVSLTDVIEQEVGVQVRSSGGVGGFSSLLLRGANSEQVTIYLDGVALNDASGGPVDLSLIALDNIERIEIYRGSTPLELGSPSIGGAVNIITRQSVGVSQIEESSRSSISATVASFQTYKLSASSNIIKDKNRFLLSASYLQSENDFSFSNDNGTPANTLDDRGDKRQNDGVKHLTGLLNWKAKVSEAIDTSVRLNISDRKKELPNVINSSASNSFVDTQTYNVLGQLNAKQLGFDNLNLNLKVFASQKDEVFDDTLAQLSFFNQRVESITKKLGSQIYVEIIKPLQHWKFLGGVGKETYNTENSLLAVQSDKNIRNKIEASVESVSYFYSEQLILNFVVRYQSLSDEIATVINEFGEVEPGFERRHRFVNPQLGIKYRFNNRTFLTANVGQYSRAPSFVELFGGGGLFLGDSDLKSEESINIDLGYTYTWFKPYHWSHDAEIYVGIFYNQIDDLIVRTFNGQGVGVPGNISDAVIQGLEITLKLKPAKRHAISANLNLIDSFQNSEETAFDDKKIQGYYEKAFLLHYVYTINKWLFSLEADIKRDMFYDRSNLRIGDDVNLYNAGIRYLFKSSNIDFRINNIRDENIRYFRNRVTPGLSASLTFNATF